MKNTIDRDKIRTSLRSLHPIELLGLFDKALDYVPKTKLPELINGYINLESVQASPPGAKALLSEIEQFEKASWKGKYYDSFNVNSQNYMEQSSGTKTWIKECERLFNQCISKSKQYPADDIQQAMETLFKLLNALDEGEEIVFFADEGGSWQVYLEWKKVLSTYFQCLSTTSKADDYAKKAIAVINDFVHYDKKKFITLARKNTTAEQRKSLKELSSR